MAASTAGQDLFLIGSGGLECLNMSPIPFNPVNNGSPLLDLGTVGYGNGAPNEQVLQGNRGSASYHPGHAGGHRGAHRQHQQNYRETAS